MSYSYTDLAYSSAAGPRPIGGATLAVAAGDGALFAAASPTSPMRLIVYRGDVFVTILKCVGRNGDQLAIDGALGHPDAAVASGDYVENGLAADDLNDLWTSLQSISLTPGPKGDPGAPGSVWREGTGAPSNTLGVDGDYYLDGSTGDVYLRASGVYSVVANLKGPKGDKGDTGADGAQGPKGDTGATGADGSPGTQGSVWRESSGGPSNTLGVDGDYYLDGSTGDVYLRASGVYSVVANLKGPKGDTGADGVQGPPGVGSFGLSMPAGFGVAGSPLTTNGTITVSTSFTGVAKATATGFVAAVPDVDYSTPTALAAKADDSTVVHAAGAETISGFKTFLDGLKAGNVTIGSVGGGSIAGGLAATPSGFALLMTGDLYGPVSVTLLNRNGANGVKLATNDSLADLCELIFGTYSTSLQPMSFRIEARRDETAAGSKSLQVGVATDSSGASLPHYAATFEAAVDQTTFYGSLLSAPQSKRDSYRGGGGAARATLDARGSVACSRTQVSTTTYTVGDDDFQLDVTGASAKTINLRSDLPADRRIIVKDKSGNASTAAVTITAPAGGAIDGASSKTIATDYGSLHLYHDGAGVWFTV